MKILVSGGSGYIGSHTTVELQKAGYEVVIVDSLFNSHADVIDKITEISGKRPHFEQFDLSDTSKTDDFFCRHQDIVGVIHFAAHKAVGESVEQPLLYYRNNILSLINVLQNMDKYGISSLVFSSSCTVYGQPEVLPVSEDAPIQKAYSPYGNTKKIAEDIIKDVADANKNIHSVVLRYFNPIGAHESAKIGELPIGVPNNLVPYITQTAIGIRDQLSVYGSDYNTPDGTCIRDYIHVVDLAAAHVVAMERMLFHKNKSNVEYFNIGTGKGYSVLEAITAFEKVSGVKLPYVMVDRRAGDTEKVWADTQYANEELGWKAEKGLEEMMKSAWAWQQELSKV